jgi:hypothetical protein
MTRLANGSVTPKRSFSPAGAWTRPLVEVVFGGERMDAGRCKMPGRARMRGLGLSRSATLHLPIEWGGARVALRGS